MNKYVEALLAPFRYHKKKIAFLFASLAFGILVLFPYDDLSDFITLKVTQMTQSNVYLQFDGLSFGLLPQLGILMDNVVVETVQYPTLSLKTLGFAPSFSLLLGKPSGKVKAYGLFGGDGEVSFGPSNELETEGPEFGADIELTEVNLKEISKILQDKINFPLTMNGQTTLTSSLAVDTSYKAQPKGDFSLNIQKLNIPSATIPLQMSMTFPFPALKISEVKVDGNINDGKLTIRQGKIGDPKNDLHGDVTGDIYFEVVRGGKVMMGGYDLTLNINIKDSLKRQLGFVLTFIDNFEKIGDRYKFDSLNGVRYNMRLSARSMSAPPRVTAAQ